MPDQSEDYIPTHQAAALFNLTEGKIRRLIQTKRLPWRESDDSVLLEDVNTQLELMEYDRLIASGLSEREDRKQIANRNSHTTNPKSKIQNPKSPAHPPAHPLTHSPIHIHVSVNDAAHLLGVSRRQIFHLC